MIPGSLWLERPNVVLGLDESHVDDNLHMFHFKVEQSSICASFRRQHLDQRERGVWTYMGPHRSTNQVVDSWSRAEKLSVRKKATPTKRRILNVYKLLMVNPAGQVGLIESVVFHDWFEPFVSAECKVDPE